MQYSPKLKRVIEEIKQTLKTNDIAGSIVLHTPGFSEHLQHVTTSYSCAKIENAGIRFKIQSKEIGEAEAKRLAEGTYNMLTHLAHHTKKTSDMYENIYQYAKEKWGGTEEGGEASTHIEQNN